MTRKCRYEIASSAKGWVAKRSGRVIYRAARPQDCRTFLEGYTGKKLEPHCMRFYA